MPLDTSAYNLALLRVDGRRWNELRRVHAQIRTQAAADGSSYLEMGHTKVMCVVAGPSEPGPRRGGGVGSAGGGGGGGGGGAGGQAKEAEVVVSIVIAGFSSVDRKRRGRGDKRTLEMQSTVANALAASLHTHLFPHSQISISLHVLSQDGSLLAALINAATLACVDAGIPMTDYVAACTAGSTSTYAANDEGADPLLDLNHQEEQELPGLTVATLGESDRVAVLVCESRVQVSRLEGMLAVGVDGCKQVREILDRVVRERGHRMIQEGTVEKGVGLNDMDLD
ncbi:Exosome complex component SKI6 [Madurella mycetomatis]|uniref:Exosome complex component SKI6 n=1 Tax=Madurella mycetomatis TaxID=100816 RepID=A0A175W7T3_9PEZI|nr:Exosome complex component SKI6 [Madurella mycetomatis]